MDKIKGYAHIVNDPKTIVSPIPNENFAGKVVRVLDWAVDGSGILAIDSQSTGLAQIDNADISRSFKCEVFANAIIPPGLNEIDKILYYSKLTNRKGGYSDILRKMSIAIGLSKGEFDDRFLFQQPESM